MPSSFDVVVVGAGTAGANAAYQFARRGRKVLLVERRPAHLAGAQWNNGVLDRHFHRAGLEPPSGPERASEGGAVHLRATDPRIGPDLHVSPTVGADMALLGDRLRGLALGAGAELIDQVDTIDVHVEARNGRIRSLALRRDGALPRPVTAALIVDASGRRGVIRRHAAHLTRWCPTLRTDELCSASDVHHEITDAGAAKDFLSRHGAEPGDAVTFVGTHGGFSTTAITVSADVEHVGILVGCLANGRYSTGPRMVAEVLEKEAWIGARTKGGSGVIPLRRPFARFTAPGIALVGDAACQVFPAHGSGIGIGLIAGTMLAEGVADADDPGDADTLWRRYQAPFQHRYGGDLAGFDALRRATTRLGAVGVDGLVRSGVMDGSTAQAGLDQRWATPPPAQALRSAGRLLRNPRLAAVMLPSLARAQTARAWAAHHPAEQDVEALARWEGRMQRILGPVPA